MARAKTNKLYRTFVKGLITEAGYLTYPEDASIDELNTVLFRKGNRTRRQGVDYEVGYSFADLNADRDSAVSEYTWFSVGNQNDLNYLVVQVGGTVHFWDLSSSPISDSKKTFTFDLNTYRISSATSIDIATNPCQFAAGKGYLFISHPYSETVLIEYNSTTDTISHEDIEIMIRDFDGLDDGLSNDDEPTVLTKEHSYNLMNQGWNPPNSKTTLKTGGLFLGSSFVSAAIFAISGANGNFVNQITGSHLTGPIQKFFTYAGRYPGNNKQWWVARAEADDPDKGIKAGDFLPEILDKQYSGNSRSPRGHFVLNAFKKDRTSVSGIQGLTVVAEKTRSECVAFFSGRAWYAGRGQVFYSQIIEGKSKVGLCYQEADPTSEDISDLIATDGGQIQIPEADRIVRLIPQDNSILVFATNGVWSVSGGSAGFAATDISVDKVSNIGTKSPFSVVLVNDEIYWWSEVGINAMKQESSAFGPIPGKFGNTNIAEQTIQSFYNAIPEQAKYNCKGVYDARAGTVQWFYKDTEEEDAKYFYDSCVIFDTTLQAFYPWRISQGTAPAAPFICGALLEPGVSVQTTTAQVVDDLNNTVVTETLDNVIISVYNTVIRPSSLRVIVFQNGDITFGEFSNQSFVDWETYDNVGLTYESYIETGYELLEDSMRRKQAVYVVTHFRRTENDTLLTPTSCKFRVKWDWAGTESSKKWSTEVEAYRPRVFQMPVSGADNDFPVVTSKHKVRGSGRAIQFRFGSSERDKTFDLIGWSTAYVGNTEP